MILRTDYFEIVNKTTKLQHLLW